MNWLSAQEIIDAFGDWAAIAVAVIIFFETAFILTSFLPGDSLLFLTGLTLSTSESWLPDWVGFVLVWFAAVAGTQVGYLIGRTIGPPLFRRNRNFILNDRVLDKTHQFFNRYGARAIVLARFVPILRALIPMLAGISQVPIKRFTWLNVLGATIWIAVFMVPGYWLGGVELIKQNLEITVIVIVVLTSLFLPIELLRERLSSRARSRRESSAD